MTQRTRRLAGATIVVGLLALAALVLVGIRQARAMPVVRRLTVEIPQLPAGTPPLRLALLSDVHVGNLATPPERLARIVAQVNARKPDAIVIAGDFVNGDYPGDAKARPDLLGVLAGLRAPLGVFATLGNHDNWTDARAVTAALRKANITVMANGASRFGPFVFDGIDDATSGMAKTGLAMERARHLRGIPIAVTHSPSIEAWIKGPIPLLLAGHTHCGQAVLRLGAQAIYPTEFLKGRPYPKVMRCGVGRVRGMVTVVTGGIGTSGVPMRYGAPPDWWLITLAPVSRPGS